MMRPVSEMMLLKFVDTTGGRGTIIIVEIPRVFE